MKKILLPFLLLVAIIYISATTQTDHHRWAIKTTPARTTKPKTIELSQVITFPDPPDVKMNDKRYEDKLIPAFTNDLNLKEGDLISIKGYMHLVAFEKEDDEYHIQISQSETDGNNCLIVEVPDPKNTDNPELKTKYQTVRDFIRDSILHGKNPGTKGNIIEGRAYVKITGQLFFDASHTHNQVRGKKGMRSNCLWEIHPITSMSFALRP